MRPFSWAFSGSFIGLFVFPLIIGPLDNAYRLYPDDMQSWLFYAVPAGVIFGSITGCVLGLAAGKKNKAAASVGVTSALSLGLLHMMLIPDAMHRMSSSLFTKAAMMAYAYAQYGPGLLWSAFLFAFGIRCCIKSFQMPHS